MYFRKYGYFSLVKVKLPTRARNSLEVSVDVEAALKEQLPTQPEPKWEDIKPVRRRPRDYADPVISAETRKMHLPTRWFANCFLVGGNALRE